MNLKMLLPTYRTRYSQLIKVLKDISKSESQSENRTFLNLGCGEGDFDKVILSFFTRGFGCDVNEGDIAHCKYLSAGLALQYEVDDAHSMKYEDESFDCVVCLDVIEHTALPSQVIKESYRVIKPGGYAIFSFPRLNFPFTYDPVNYLLSSVGKHLPIGAYAFGHDKLIDDNEFSSWVAAAGYKQVSRHSLTGALIAGLECYWVGFLQRLLKSNSRNEPTKSHALLSIRPSAEVTRLAGVVDMLIDFDAYLFPSPKKSVGSLYVLRKDFK